LIEHIVPEHQKMSHYPPQSYPAAPGQAPYDPAQASGYPALAGPPAAAGYQNAMPGAPYQAGWGAPGAPAPQGYPQQQQYAPQGYPQQQQYQQQQQQQQQYSTHPQSQQQHVHGAVQPRVVGERLQQVQQSAQQDTGCKILARYSMQDTRCKISMQDTRCTCLHATAWCVPAPLILNSSLLLIPCTCTEQLVVVASLPSLTALPAAAGAAAGAAAVVSPRFCLPQQVTLVMQEGFGTFPEGRLPHC